MGCYADYTNNIRDLPLEIAINDNTMTINKCISLCLSNGYLYAGAQFS